MDDSLATEIRRLSSVEKLKLVEAIWDDLAAGAEPLPIPDWHRQVLAEDEVHYRSNPAEGSPWPDVKTRITRES